MTRAFTVVLCFVLFLCLLTADALALTPAVSPASPQTAKVAAALARLGAGPDALVALCLRDHTVVKGRVAALAADSFVVADNDSGVDSRVPYAQVVRLEGMNLDTGARVHVGGGFKARVARAALRLLPAPRVQPNHLTNSSKTLLIGIIIGVILAIVLAKAL